MKRVMRLNIALLLSMALLTGCSSPSASPAPSESPLAEAAESSEAPGEQPEASLAEAPEAATAETEQEPVTLLVAAAASLEYSFRDELIPLFQEQNSWITVEGSYDSSGKLQTQIEEGLEADVFMSATTKQMTALVDKSLVDRGSVVDLLENKIVLVLSADSDSGIANFEDIVSAESIAVGDPASVPAGQYTQEALTSLGLWDQVLAKASLGANVTEVLSWVSAGSAEAGIVYATDAATTSDVKVIAEAPEGSLAQKIIYPVGIVSGTAHREAAELFTAFLQSEEALAIFAKYGFTPNI